MRHLLAHYRKRREMKTRSKNHAANLKFGDVPAFEELGRLALAAPLIDSTVMKLISSNVPDIRLAACGEEPSTFTTTLYGPDPDGSELLDRPIPQLLLLATEYASTSIVSTTVRSL